MALESIAKLFFARRVHSPAQYFSQWKRTKLFTRKIKNEEGSISVVVIGLFVITVASLMVMTDVSALIVAKRSLVQATEAAAQRGVHTLIKLRTTKAKQICSQFPWL